MLLTKDLETTFWKYPIGSQLKKGLDAEVLVKYYNPCGSAVWLVTEAEKLSFDNDWLLYGYFYMNGKWKWDYVRLSDLQKVRLPYNKTIERSALDTGGPIFDYM